MARIKLKARIRYLFDRSLARGTASLLGWLVVCVGAFLLAVSLLVAAIDRHKDLVPGSLPHQILTFFWNGVMRIVDPGGILDSHPLQNPAHTYVVTMFIITIVGILVMSVVIGIMAAGFDSQLRKLSRGRSRVLEKDHTLILGWSKHAFTIVSELLEANQSRKSSAIVILSQADPVDLLEQIRTKVGPLGKTRVICRSGSAMDLNDLETVSFATARAIIVLPVEGVADSDSAQVKTLLALVKHPRRRPEPLHIVMSMHDPRNGAVARIVAGNEVEVVLWRDALARIVAQTCRQPGLSVVHTELLDFAGDEIYMAEEPGLVGKTFGEALTAYAVSAPIGLMPKSGQPQLNPPMDSPIAAGDQIIAITADDSSLRLGGEILPADDNAIRTATMRPTKPGRTLILGWSPETTAMIDHLDAYVPAGSTVTVVSHTIPDSTAWAAGLADLENQTVSSVVSDPTDRGVLDGLDIPSYDHVIACGSGDPDPQIDDAQAMLTLLHLRDIKQTTGCSFSLVTEMNDARNRDLAAITETDDFVVSENLLSLMLVQVAENKHLKAVFDDIFDSAGSEIYLKPAADYVELGRPVGFATVIEAARRRNEVAIGYRLSALGKDAARKFGVTVNPDKSLPVELSEGDTVIVLARD
jgi:voltage-gated potassium channel Kch